MKRTAPAPQPTQAILYTRVQHPGAGAVRRVPGRPEQRLRAYCQMASLEVVVSSAKRACPAPRCCPPARVVRN